MRVFVAGATGAIGKRLVPVLVARGHEVIGTTRSREKMRLLYELGAQPVIVDGLDRESVLRRVRRIEPEVVVHQMTGLAGVTNLRRLDSAFTSTNRLRTAGTDYLLEAARGAGARRFVAQSFGNWMYEPSGSTVKTEEDPLDTHPPRTMRRTLAAIVHLELAVLGAKDLEGIVLRYGNLYGPGTGWADPALIKLLCRRALPIIGTGAGVFSFIHVDDAAIATVAAIEAGALGIYNVADDLPAPVSVWLPELAAAVGAGRPRRVPVWLGRLAAGEAVVWMFTRSSGAANGKAKRALRWRLLYPSWRDGFRNAETTLDPAALAKLLEPRRAAA
jgi:2-alkyl-3-oxoalkanoate reductase